MLALLLNNGLNYRTLTVNIASLYSNHWNPSGNSSGNLFKMAAKIKFERVWVRGLETGENEQSGGKGKLIWLRWAFN